MKSKILVFIVAFVFIYGLCGSLMALLVQWVLGQFGVAVSFWLAYACWFLFVACTHAVRGSTS